MCIHYHYLESQLPNQPTLVLRQITWPNKSEAQAQFGIPLGDPIGVGTTTQPLGLKAKLSLEDLFIIVYVVVDDAYKKLFGSQAALRRSPNNDPIFTDVEVITLALVAELAGYESQHAWWNFVNKNYRYLFRHLCDRTRYGRRLRNLRVPMEQLRQHLLFLLNLDLTQLRVIDSFPLSVCHLRRVGGSSTPFEYFATFGYCAAKKEYFYGFRVHVVSDARGVVIHYLLTSGHVHDTKGLVFLLQDAATLPVLLERLLTLIGDKGYIGAELHRRIKEEFGIDLMALRKENETELGVSAYNETVGSIRKIIETTFSVLTGVMNAAWTYARSIPGLVTNLVTKMTAFNLGNYLNQLMGKPILQISSFVN